MHPDILVLYPLELLQRTTYSYEEVESIMKIVKSLEESSLLIESVRETIKSK